MKKGGGGGRRLVGINWRELLLKVRLHERRERWESLFKERQRHATSSNHIHNWKSRRRGERVKGHTKGKSHEKKRTRDNSSPFLISKKTPSTTKLI